MPNTHEHSGGRESSPEAMLAEQFTATESRLLRLERSVVKSFVSTAVRDQEWPSPRVGLMCLIGTDLWAYTTSGWRRYAGTT